MSEAPKAKSAAHKKAKPEAPKEQAAEAQAQPEVTAKSEAAPTTTEASAPAANKVIKRKAHRFVTEGRVYVKSTYNNTIITFTDSKGEVIAWTSAGSSGFKGPRKSTPYAASVAAQSAVEKAKAYGVEKVHAFIKGVGSGREQALRSIQGSGINILSIRDLTPIPHNGCRHRKARRV